MNHLKKILLNSFKNYPEHVAITYNDKKITYKSLYEKVKVLTNYLQDVQNSSVVTIYMNRSIETVIAVLATILADRIFCAIDINTPKSNILKIVQEIESNIIITDETYICSLPMSDMSDKKIYKLSLKDSNSLSIIEYGKNFYTIQSFSTQDVSHIIYTSGSTNLPKGVLARQTSLINFISWEHDILHIVSKNIATAQISTPWFDPYARDLFLPLFYGGCVCIPNKRQLFDARAFFDFSKRNKINVIHIVPTLFRQLFLNQKYYEDYSIEHILLAGEMVHGDDIKKYRERFSNGQLYNLYGPTETTMSKFYHIINKNDICVEHVHVGKPLPDTFCKIIDNNGKELPFGNEGEIVIYTKFASLGYLKRPQLNKEYFADIGNGIVEYRTSDMGIMHSADDLEVVGRKDNMKKIYGQKIHSEEIESVMLKYSEVKNCAAYITENKVIALVEKTNNFQFKILEDILNKYLLKYKIPSEILLVIKIPLNKNGKIDRKNIDNIDESYIIERIPVKLK